MVSDFRTYMRPSDQKDFTLVEYLVLDFINDVAVALLLSASQSLCYTARRVTGRHMLRLIGLAFQNASPAKRNTAVAIHEIHDGTCAACLRDLRPPISYAIDNTLT